VGNEIETKTERIVKLLEREKLGGVLLNAQHNFAWITGGGSNGIDLSRENGAASIFVRRDGKRFLLANNIEMPRMFAEEVSPDEFEPVEFSWQDEKSGGAFLIKKATSLSERTIASDLALHEMSPAIESKLVPCRYELTEEELVSVSRPGQRCGQGRSGCDRQDLARSKRDRDRGNDACPTRDAKYRLGRYPCGCRR
jgi:hypothetical protein